MNWQDERMMNPAQLRWYIRALGMKQAAAGRYLGVSERTIRRMVRGEAEVPPAMVLLLRSLHHHKEKPVVPRWIGIREQRRQMALSLSTRT